MEVIVKFTKHGEALAFERTKLHPKNVLSILESTAVVELGKTNKALFVLFRSPGRRDNYKIAILSPNKSVCLSIRDEHYQVPDGVQKPTKELKQEAWKRMNAFLWERVKGNHEIPPETELHLEVAIYLGSSRIGCYLFPTPIDKITASSLIDTIRREAEFLRKEVLFPIESVRSDFSKVRYLFRILDGEAKEVRVFPTIKHRTLRKYLHPED